MGVKVVLESNFGFWCGFTVSSDKRKGSLTEWEQLCWSERGLSPSCTSSNNFLLNSHLWLLDNFSDPGGLYWLSLGRESKGNPSAESHLQTLSDSGAFISHYLIWARQTSAAFLDLVSRCLSRQSFPVTWRFYPKISKISLHQLKYLFFRKNIILNTASL